MSDSKGRDMLTAWDRSGGIALRLGEVYVARLMPKAKGRYKL
jgi:hypothetical protein